MKTKVYQFKELDKKTKEKVIREYKINLDEDIWYDSHRYYLNDMNIELVSFESISISNIYESCKRLLYATDKTDDAHSIAKDYIKKHDDMLAKYKSWEETIANLNWEYEKKFSKLFLADLRDDYGDFFEVNKFKFTKEGAKIFTKQS